MSRKAKIPTSIGMWSPKLAVAWLRDNGWLREARKVEAEFIANKQLPTDSNICG